MKKIIALLLACMMVIGMFAACAPAGTNNTTTAPGTNPSDTKPTDAKPEEITLKVWAPAEDQGDETKWLNIMLKKFEEAHPEYKITWQVEVCSEGDAAKNITGDVSAAADVFMYANDQLGTLIAADALAKLGGDYLAQVKADNSATYVNTVTYTDGGVYGFPYTPNTWFLYYDKSVFSAEEVKSLETMLTKGVVGFPVINSWYIGAFFFGAGATLFGEQGVDAAAGMQLGDKAEAVGEYLVNLMKNPNFKNDDNGGLAMLTEKKVNAYFSGSWDAQGVKDALGENMGVAQLPTFTLNGETCQMKAFAGSKAIGVNKHSAHPRAAMQLAAFLSSEEAQLKHYELRGIIPAAAKLAENATIAADPVALGSVLTMNNTAIGQPTIPEMGNWWTPAETFGKALNNGQITVENVKEQVKLFQDALNGTGL